MKKRLIPACVIFTLLLADAGAEMHTWTNLAGQKLEAEMVGMDIAAKAVRLRRPDGQVFAIPIGNLSAEDVSYAAAQWRLMQAKGTPAAPVTPAAASGLNLAVAGPRYASRCSEASRMNLVLENGGSVASEEAVTKSLAWLKTKQSSDGSWPGPNKAAMTGFALQCYTGRCEGPDSLEYGDTVTKGILYLIELAGKNPQGMLGEEVKSGGATYAHAIATCGLGEVQVMTRGGAKQLPGMRETFEKAMRLIIDSQNDRGSWTYGGIEAGFPVSYNKTSKGEDLSLANWHFLALLVGRESGLDIPNLDRSIGKALSYIESKQTKDGGFGGANRDQHYNQWALSGGAIVGLQTLGTKSTQSSKGISFLRGYLTSEPLDWDKTCNLYSWAAYTPAFYQAGGADWKFYVGQWLPQMLAAQNPDGSFKNGRPSWPASGAANEVYRQTLCTLQLEVFYRNAK